MASKGMVCNASTAPLVSSRSFSKLVGLRPCSVAFPVPKKPSLGSRLVVKAQQAGGAENKEGGHQVDVQLQKSNNSNRNQSAAVERRPRRLAVDISPFGKFN